MSNPSSLANKSIKFLTSAVISLILLTISSNAHGRKVKLKVQHPTNGSLKHTIVALEQDPEGIILWSKNGFKEVVLVPNSNKYYLYAYINETEHRRIKMYEFNSSSATQHCPFIIWSTLYGEISSYEIYDCNIDQLNKKLNELPIR